MTFISSKMDLRNIRHKMSRKFIIKPKKFGIKLLTDRHIYDYLYICISLKTCPKLYPLFL